MSNYNNRSNKPTKPTKPTTSRSRQSSGKDPVIRNLNDLLVGAVANFNWSYPLGVKVPVYEQPSSSADYKSMSFPLLETFDVLPNIGISEDATSPCHTLATVLYNYIVRINSANVPYDPVDLELAVVAMANVYAFHAWAKRIYRIVNTYSMENRALPHVLGLGNYVNLSDILENLSDYRAWFNNFTIKASMLAFPDDVALFNEYDQIFSNVYVDHDAAKAQMYMFVPSAFYKYDEINETPNEGVGRLVPVPVRDIKAQNNNLYAPQWSNADPDVSVPTFIPRVELLGFEDIKWMAEQLIRPLLQSEDISRICADIFKAYSEGNVHKLSLLEENETISVLYSPEMLARIENMRIVPQARQFFGAGSGTSYGTPVANYYPLIQQDPNINAGFAIFNYYPFDLTTQGSYDSHETGAWKSFYTEKDYIFNAHDRIPTSDDALMMASYTNTMDTVNTRERLKVTSCSPSLITQARIWSAIYNQNGEYGFTYRDFETYIGENMRGGSTNNIATAALTSKFDWHPQYTIVSYNSGNHEYLTNDFFDVDTYAIVPKKDVKQLLDTIILGTFKCPGYNYSVTSGSR